MATAGRPLQDPRRGFEQLYENHAARVYGFFAYRLVSRTEAEDLTQIVFEKALRAWGRYDSARASEGTWLFAIAHNVLIDHLRRRREEPAEDVVERLDRSRGDEGALELSVDLAEALAELGPRERTVIALRFGADLTGAEIGRVAGVSRDNAHQILSRALRKLRASLELIDK